MVIILFQQSSVCAATLKRALFYGPTTTFSAPGNFSSSELQEIVNDPTSGFAPIGTTSTSSIIWNEATWLTKSVSAFGVFDVIIIDDRAGEFGGNGGPSALWSTAVGNRQTWSTAANGNVAIVGGDPSWSEHYGPQTKSYLQKLLNFAADKTGYPANQQRTGFLFVSGQIGGSVFVTQTLDILGGFGSFTCRATDADKVALVASHTLLDFIRPSDLADLGDSAHLAFQTWPSGFYPFALGLDYGYQGAPPASFYTVPFRSPEYDSVNGFTAPWILVRGAQRQLKPLTYLQSKQAGQTCTITAVLQTLGTTPTPISGQRIGFTITSGPNIGRTGTFAPTTRLTDAQGQVSFTYTPVASPVGMDHVTIYFDNNNNNIWEPNLGEGSVEALVSWGTPTVSIAAIDASAAEQNSDPAVFRITRTGGSLSQPLTVPVVFRDAAFARSTGAPVPSEDDYVATAPTAAQLNILYDKTGTVVIPAGQSSVDITITPIDDSLSEGTEKIECAIRQSSAYSISPNFIAVATIQDNDAPVVNVTALDDTASEDPTLSDTGIFLFTRTGGTTAPLTVFYTLPLGAGRALYGGDYLLDQSLGSVTFSQGQTDLQLQLTAVVDSRNEGAETVRLDLATPLDPTAPAYALGSQSSATIIIIDNPANNIPIPNTYTIVDLGTIGANTNQAPLNPTSRGFAISSSGIVAGDYTPPYSLGSGTHAFRYYNGGLSDLNTYSLGSASAAYAFGVNSAGVTVGTYYDSAQGIYSAIRWTDPMNFVTLPPVSINPVSSVTQAIAVGENNGYPEWTVGWSRNAQGRYRAVVWEAGWPSALDLGTLAGSDYLLQSYAFAVNNHPFGHRATGKSVYREDSTVFHAFLSDYQVDSIGPDNDLGTVWGVDEVNSEGTGVNDFNEVVGSSMTSALRTHAFIKAPETGKHAGFTDLGVLSGDIYSKALGMSNNGFVVGLSGDSGYIEKAVVWYNNGQIANLITKVSNPTGWTLSAANAVNASGWICGTGFKNGIQRAFLLIPN